MDFIDALEVQDFEHLLEGSSMTEMENILYSKVFDEDDNELCQSFYLYVIDKVKEYFEEAVEYFYDDGCLDFSDLDFIDRLDKDKVVFKVINQDLVSGLEYRKNNPRPKI